MEAEALLFLPPPTFLYSTVRRQIVGQPVIEKGDIQTLPFPQWERGTAEWRVTAGWYHPQR